MITSTFKIPKKRNNVLSSISPINYSILSPAKGTGKGVKICIIDSGVPEHKDLPKATDKISFCDENQSTKDQHGHSTMISGIIDGNNKNSIIGYAPDVSLFYAKVVNDGGSCNFNAIVASLLWAIVKQVDVITIALGGSYDLPILHETIKKVKQKSICIFASAGNNINSSIFPSSYPEVFSIYSLPKQKKNNKKNIFSVSHKKLITTYLKNKYISAYGSSIATACYSGIACQMIEEYKEKLPKHEIPPLVYSNLRKIKEI